MFGFGRPQPTSAEKIAAVENELKVVAEMHSRYVFRFPKFNFSEEWRRLIMSEG